MFQYTCLNPISQMGLEHLTADYQKTEGIEAERTCSILSFGRRSSFFYRKDK